MKTWVFSCHYCHRKRVVDTTATYPSDEWEQIVACPCGERSYVWLGAGETGSREELVAELRNWSDEDTLRAQATAHAIEALEREGG